MNSQKVPGGNELLNPEKILKNELGLEPGSYVGDFGCGAAGYFSFQTAKIVGDSGLVYAVDIQKPVLESIRNRAKENKINNLKTIWTDLERFSACKINNNSLDFGFLINILFQNKDKKAILKEVSRMIKDGGKLLIIDWKEGRFPLGPKPQDKIGVQDLISAAQEVGFRLEKRFEAGQYHYGLIFIK